MKYSPQEIMQYVREEDVKFIRLAFCDIYGKQKNISIMPSELSRAFEYGIAIDASAIDGFGDEAVRTYCFIRIRKHWPFCHGVPNTAGSSVCSAILPIRMAKPLNVIPGVF